MATPSGAHRTAPLLEQVSTTLSSELSRYLARHRGEVEAMIRTGGGDAGLPAARRHAKCFDGLLNSLFHAVKATLRRTDDITLGAVGSYGRGAVAYSSDLDVRLLTPGGDPESVGAFAEALLYPLWDAGLSIGHQVFTADEVIDLARTDLPTLTSLLDWRDVAGDFRLSKALLGRVFEGVLGFGEIKAFIELLRDRAADRHERFGGSVYLLEPDVKNGPGGIRDLDVAHWAARARWRVSDLSELVRLGVLVPREWQSIAEANDFMWRVRNLLHVHADRRSDRLSFDRQEQLADDLGHGSGGPAVERFMSEYYRHARVIERSRDMILSRALPPPQRRPHAASIGNGLTLVNGTVSLSHPAQLDSEPGLALRLYDEAVRRDLPVYEFARDTVARAATLPSFGEKLRQSPEAAKLFVRLLTTAQRSRQKGGSILSELHEVGLLVALIPEFSPVVGRVHHDVYHVYTVDAHSVAAVDRLRALSRGDLAEKFPLASRLAAEVARPNVLYFATLLHDVGKDIGGKNHSERGFTLARSILERLGLDQADIAEVQHLVLKHLRMYHVATRRDIDDPATLDAFCQEVHGREGLRELYLLTLVDVSTTSPTAMTSWKARMLDELYLSAERRLEGEARAGPLDEKMRAVVASVSDKKAKKFADHFVRAMPERYLYANDRAHIEAHLRFVAGTRKTGIDVFDTDEPYLQIGFVADDEPGLLAKFTATLAKSRLAVVGAEVYSFKDVDGRARALDLFWVKGTSGTESASALLPRIERDLSRLLSGEIEAAELVGGPERRPNWSSGKTPPVRTEVRFDDRATGATVLEVTTRDRPGLLFWLAHSLQEAGLTITLAKINTEGQSVADVFYVTEKDGAKLEDPARIEEVRARILSTLVELETLEETS
jgi:[protein-PII] uridylyltransferase